MIFVSAIEYQAKSLCSILDFRIEISSSEQGHFSSDLRDQIQINVRRGYLRLVVFFPELR